MRAPALLSRLAAAARKVLTGVAAQPSDRPVDEGGALEQRAESGRPPREEPERPTTVSQSGHVTNQMSGTANKLIQAGDIHGGVRF